VTPEQITLVEQSFDTLAADPDGLARSFYTRLFTIAPSVRVLFPGDLAEQRRKLVAELAAIVGTIRQPDVLVPRAQRLGERHVGYGADNEHYTAVGMALLFTIGEQLGGDATPEVIEAWRAAYTAVADVMMAAADAHRHAAA
jgi:hemoglobin-like flavoprotein